MLSRNFMLIVLSSVVLGAPMPMLILLGALAGAALTPIPALATLPASIQILAGIAVAIPMSVYMGRCGRRNGFIVGAGLMVAGGLLAALALLMESFVVLCIAHLILGAALICFNFFRFAAAESVPEHWRAKAISYMLASGLIAALIGPLIYTHFKDALLPIPFAGAYLALACLGLVGCLPLLAMGRMLPASESVQSDSSTPLETKWQILTRPPVMLAILSAACAQAAMVLLMIPTPLAMEAYGHEGTHAADVIRWHVIAMFAPGFFTGSLILRFGCMKVITAGFVLLIAAAAVATYGVALLHFYLSLVLLGVGWNFGFVGGTYLLQAALDEREKPLLQGINDTLLAIASSLGSLSAGVLYAGVGWSALAATTIAVLVIVSVVFMIGKRNIISP